MNFTIRLIVLPLHPHEVFRPTIMRPTASAVVIHNYPSGDHTPLYEDIMLTKYLSEIG
ncbi:JAB domain-containing protein [Paenibacillus sp. strain BS8-2]